MSVLPTSQVFTSGYVNTETILHFLYKITNERGTKTAFTYAHVKWFYGQSECAYDLNYFINVNIRQNGNLITVWTLSSAVIYTSTKMLRSSLKTKKLEYRKNLEILPQSSCDNHQKKIATPTFIDVASASKIVSEKTKKPFRNSRSMLCK